MKIVLLFGGRGAEHEVSVRSAAHVYNRLSTLCHEVFPVGLAKNGALFLGQGPPDAAFFQAAPPVSLRFSDGKLSFFTDEICFSPDLVFSVVHGKDGEDGAWQGLFTLAGIDFVGAGVAASAIGMNKRLSKLLAARGGVPIVPYLTAKRYDGELAARLTHPRHQIPKIYHVKIKGKVTEEQVKALSKPMDIDGYTILPVETHLISIKPDFCVLEMILYEGRNRQIRKMCQDGIVLLTLLR